MLNPTTEFGPSGRLPLASRGCGDDDVVDDVDGPVGTSSRRAGTAGPMAL